MVDFLKGATGDPIGSKRRIFQQSAGLGLPNVNVTFRDVCSNGGAIRIARETVERLKIATGGVPGKVLPGKMPIGPFTWELGDINPVDYGLIQTLMNLFGVYDNDDQTTFRRWTFDLDQVTAAADLIGIINDTNVLLRATVYDALCGGITITAATRENFKADAAYVAGGFHWWDDPSQITGTGADLPTILGALYIPNSGAGNGVNQMWEDTPLDLFVEAQTVAAGVVTLRCKIGAAAAYSNTQTYTLGDPPIELQDESGNRIGPIRDPIRLWWPAGATLVSLDEFQVAPQRADFTPTIATDRAIAMVNTVFYKDGVRIRTENGWNLEVAWENLEIIHDPSGSQGGTPFRSGELKATLSIDRYLLDLDLQKALHDGETIACVIEGETDALISGAGRPYKIFIILPALEPQGELYGVEAGGENRNEQITLIARAPDSALEWPAGSGLMYGSHVAFVLENDVAAP